MKNRKFAYVRVSSRDQNVARQLDAMRALGIDERDIFIDKQTGKDFDRVEYQLLKRMLRSNDILYIHSLDRLGRNKELIAQEWYDITKNIGADIVVLDMPLLDTTKTHDAVGQLIVDLTFSILSWIAEDERNRIAKQRNQGIESARKRGVKFGRKAAVITPEFLDIYNRWQNKEFTATKAIELSGYSRTTFYKLVNKIEEKSESMED